MQSGSPARTPVSPDDTTADAWRALDEPQEWESFSRPLPDRAGWHESYLAIQGMHCASCALTVEHALAQLPGVERVQVNGASATARIAWSPQLSRPSQWMTALRQAGYGALPAGDLLDAAARVKEQRLLLWRWLVAGFCMMQVMMYAVPAYVAAPGEITPDIESLLRWASWVLTLPVVLFSCWPFFAAALRDLRHRTLGMDVPVALGIAIAFGASTAATFDAGGILGREVWYDSVTMFVFFLLSGRLLEQRLRDRTAGSLQALMRRLPQTIERRRPEATAFERVPVRRLAVADVIRVLPGEVFPADGHVLEGETRVDEALLTGESRPLWRSAGEPVIAGSQNLSGVVLVHVDRTGSQTRYAGIVALMEQASIEKPRLARLADRVATPFLGAVLVAAAAAGAWWWAVDPSQALGVAVAVLIVTCPCALSLATPAATLAAAGALARQGVLVRRLQALESCASVDTVVFDKTGTLTQDRMGVVALRARGGIEPEAALTLAAALARHSLHPASRAIAAAAGAAAGPAASGVVEVAGRGVQGWLPQRGGGQAQQLRLGSAAFCAAPEPPQDGGNLSVHLADDSGWLATFELDEALRPDALPAVRGLRDAGLQVQLLSGDRTVAVRRLAQRAGIDVAQGDCTPEDKLTGVALAQLHGHRVAMVGDGVNDAPVLARADVSIAMGDAVPLAQAKSDFVVLGGQLQAVRSLIGHAQRTQRIVRQNLAWAAAYNAVCVPLAVIGWMPPWLAGIGMAASSLLVVANSARLARVRGTDPSGSGAAAAASALALGATP
ncbi:cation-translocating P-type ATPase [Ramlibacter sp.]|uniref:heavy metal translocating P-type ATPase n=1 Tax=Ramlibacter sp. TaxID=1917967 RepID=UPI002C763CBD|nr:cation-translocating P-type ATPase [Ramlibacter sp.]HWI81196.1 cation-translocating P-type ATPase [Ramlibacter sp.]